MDAAFQFRLGATETGSPPGGMPASGAGPSAPSGPASFLAVLDRAFAADPLPAPQPAEAPEAPPAPGPSAPAPAAAQPQVASTKNEPSPADAPPELVKTEGPAPSQDAEFERPRATDEEPADPKADRPAEVKEDDAGEGKRSAAASNARGAGADKSEAQPAEQEPAGAPEHATRAASGKADQPAADAALPARARRPAAHSEQPADARQAHAQPPAGGEPSQDGQPAPQRAAGPAVAAHVPKLAQERLPGMKGATRPAGAEKASLGGEAVVERHAGTARGQAASAELPAQTAKTAGAQVAAEKGEGADGQARSAQGDLPQEGGGPAKRVGTAAREAARPAAGDPSKKAPPAPRTAADAPARAASVQAQAAHPAQARPLDAGADAVTMQAWRRYDAQAGDGYRQQVQTLAGRAASDVSAQIIRQAQYIRHNGNATIRMQLNPPEMGRIRLVVQMRSERMEVRMQVENPDVRRAMSRELAGLDRTLRDAQVDVQRFEVTDYQSGRRSPERDGAYESGPAGGPGTELRAPGEQDDTAVGWARISASGTVDCLI